MGPTIIRLQEYLDEHIQNPDHRERLKKSLRHLADVKFALDESSIVAVTDRYGKIQYVNDKFCEISKYERSELLGHDHRIINSGYHSKPFMRNLWQTITSGKIWHGDIKNRAKDDTYYWVHTTIVPFLDESGTPYQYLSIRNEVTELKRVEEELQQMMTHVMKVQEEERRRFSRELHDGIGQSLFSLLVQMDRLIGISGINELEELRTTVSTIIGDVRSLAWELRPSVLDDLGVVPAIRTYIENFTEHYHIKVHFQNNLRKRIEPNKETTIYRVIQEALTNIGKYADTAEAWVKVQDLESSIHVTIEDHGKGFTKVNNLEGIGLFNMEERARSVGGQFSIQTEIGKGTKIHLIVPC
ncbi:PAS domain-containing sensor histidine kinase [Paenibacillus aestuarii]|uniref:histidine kinase n=1 Tax=Paenibacillus aestuarii TaxID=516965 RepID=A0ABW0K670_9BACL|nr:PAS domain-containing sensor histidine kinase [Paenibacillus aestuarii]